MSHFPEHLAFKRLLPNILTLLALASGLTALRHGLVGQYGKTVLALLVAGLFDVLDGRVARLLGTPSKFGAELDSLSDLVCFGVTPAFVLYLWALSSGGTLGWLAVLGFVLCAALRLARFNVMSEGPPPPAFAKKFFTGMPTPAGGAVALLPLVVAMHWPECDIAAVPGAIALWVLGSGVLMASRVPTYALKGCQIPRGAVAPLLLGIGLVAAGLANDTWATLALLVSGYVATIPFSAWHWRRLNRAHQPA